MAKTKIVNGSPVYTCEYTENYSPVWINDRMTAKMEGVACIGTSCQLNPWCIARLKNNKCDLCNYCFAQKTLNRFKGTRDHAEENTELLTTKKAVVDFNIPRFKDNVDIVRFEPFGDVINELQVYNYFEIARANSHVNFVLWSKNYGIVLRACEKFGKPENLNVIFSNPYLNGTSSEGINFIDDILFRHYAYRLKYIDGVFTVFTPDFIAENRIHINCGDKSCNGCRLCYNKHDGIKYINELLK